MSVVSCQVAEKQIDFPRERILYLLLRPAGRIKKLLDSDTVDQRNQLPCNTWNIGVVAGTVADNGLKPGQAEIDTLLLFPGEFRVVPGLLPEGDIDPPALAAGLLEWGQGHQCAEDIPRLLRGYLFQALGGPGRDMPVGQQQEVVLVVEIVGDDGGAVAGFGGDVPDRGRLQSLPGDDFHGNLGDFLTAFVVIDFRHGW